MSVEVLKSKSAIREARRELRRRGLSFTSPWWKQFARERGLSDAINVGDELKSWDVLKSVRFIEDNVSKHAPILDMGAFASELPCILHRVEYSNVSGIDLNSDIRKMPYASAVHYAVSDLVHTPFKDKSFQVISAISVIEHGLNRELLFAEVSRLLRPGGYFVASFDYWPDKQDTTGISFFGMDWTIFSEEEVRQFLQEAGLHNLTPVGEVNLSAGDRPIKCAEREYTFAWMALRKDGTNSEAP